MGKVKRVPAKYWFTGKELVEHWEIMPFELFDFVKLGLQAYSRHGQRIVNLDSLERKPRYSYNQCLRHVVVEEGGKITQVVLAKPGVIGPIEKKLTKKEIEQRARKRHESQPLFPVVPPGYIAISFTLEEKRADEQIEEAMGFLFKRPDIEKFQDEHPEVFPGEVERLEFVEGEVIDERVPEQGLPLPSEEATGPEIVEGQQRVEQRAREEKDSPELIELIRQVRPVLDSFYDAVKKYLKDYDFPTRKLAELSEKEWGEGIINIFIQERNRFDPPIKEEYLKDREFYKLDPGHLRRDFIAALLQKVVKGHYPKKPEWWGDRQKLYNFSKKYTA